MEIHLLSARGNSCTTGGQFCELPCDQTSSHEGITRYQLRDMDVNFLLIPLSSLSQVVWILQLLEVIFFVKS